MRKICFTLLFSILALSIMPPIHTMAAELPLITSGYTEKGIYFEVHGEYLQPNATTMPVTRHVTYQGNVIPPEQIPWQETVDGIKYSGTLQRSNYSYIRKDNITTATYKGTLNYYLYQ